MGLSFQWRVILKKLDEYGTFGTDEGSFKLLMGDPDVGSNNPVSSALSQMRFTQPKYWEYVPGSDSMIRITAEGRKALDDAR